MLTIALDAMGSDNYPLPDVQGGILAAREFGYHILLIGDSAIIEAELKKHDTHGLKLDIVHAPEHIQMVDKPAEAAKLKASSSMHIGMQLVKDGEANAFVTAGNTGAALAIALLQKLHRISGVKRPALGGIYPISNKHITLLDLGANADSKSDWLVQFAVMGRIYSQKMLNVPDPGVALLSNGEEESKGSMSIQEASQVLSQMPIKFAGNIEPKDILKGDIDVVVTDGFVGNIFVKTFEASASYLTSIIRDEIKKDVLSMVGGVFLRSAFNRIRRRIDTFEVGGAPLLGVNGVVIIGHGRSNEYAIMNAIHQAGQAVNHEIVDAIRQGLAEMQSSVPK